MKTRPFTLALLSAGVLVALAATPVLAQTSSTTTTTSATTSREATRLGTEFTSLAGSDANAQALVSGLRNGSPITLTEPATSAGGTATATTFTPDTGKMGYGNVKIALSLADASLAKAGISDPTSAELAAALNGGALVLADGTSIDLKGVLAERAAGGGWGQISKDLGFKLGDVMRSPKHAGEVAEQAQHQEHSKVERVELAHVRANDSVSHPGHVSKVDRPERPERPERPDHPDHAGRPGG